jgi:hypothetical protein
MKALATEKVPNIISNLMGIFQWEGIVSSMLTRDQCMGNS